MHTRSPSIDDLHEMKDAAERALKLADECGESLIAIRLHESVVVIDARIDLAGKRSTIEPGRERAVRTPKWQAKAGKAHPNTSGSIQPEVRRGGTR